MTLDHAEAVAAIGARDEALRELAAVKAENERLRARALRAEDFIEANEWPLSSSGNGRHSCPHCAKWRENGHSEVCEVGQILAFSDGKDRP